ncbi:amino acid ABC transporter permease [Verrucomicrobiales bacterium]|nr:amino acid ABC transporter permease [Verrucomicrobiales bacterium]MDB3939519.1 amino acid ABC transporter permease [Verrucomicrobiales bacterium]
MKTFLGIFVSVVLGATFCFVFWVVASHDYQWDAIAPYKGNFISGWWTTLLISVIALVGSILIGALLTSGQLSPWKVPRILSRSFVEIIRGTPLLTQILIGYYLVAPAIGWDSRFGVGFLVLSCFSGAYLSEIFRGGVESIPSSQWLSAKAIGFTDAQTYRFVVIPQAIRRVLPASAGQFANLVKDSSLLFVISVHEFTMQAREVNANTYATFEAYLPLIFGYFILTFPISLLSRSLEKRFAYEH